jgi:hypothetical protein
MANRARARGYIQLFLSHKAKDQGAAEEIFSVLKRAGGRMLEIFMCENIETGDNWQDEIEKQLHESDWFLLLFTGNNDDWSWCHHEADFFRGTMYPDPKRVVVFYPNNVIMPDPLEAFQAVKCSDDDLDDIYRFFHDLYAEDPYPDFQAINPLFAS